MPAASSEAVKDGRMVKLSTAVAILGIGTHLGLLKERSPVRQPEKEERWQHA
jgi:hypothetical protein